MITQEKQIKEELKKQIEIENNKPFIISIMGQTGVGKSSLLNALFNTNLKTDAIKPCTKIIEDITITGELGKKMIFYDLPGIGESDSIDESYMNSYLEKLKESDVVLWAIHSDNRSVTFDKRALDKLINQLTLVEKQKIFSKITFVLTKTDILTPPAWIYCKLRNTGTFTPHPNTIEILESKKSYYQDIFIKPFASNLIVETFNDCNFEVDEDKFTYDKFTVYYTGFMELSYLNYLKGKYPKYSKLFDRLYMNYEVIPCSSVFRYNLAQLMLVVINKLGKSAIGRFKQFISDNKLDFISFQRVSELCNLIITDEKQILFDFSTIDFIDNKNSKVTKNYSNNLLKTLYHLFKTKFQLIKKNMSNAQTEKVLSVVRQHLDNETSVMLSLKCRTL